jgi:hypothetical protein
LTVDDRGVGIAPLAEAIDVAPGRHHVEARTAQGIKAADTLSPAGRVSRVTFVLRESTTAPPARTASQQAGLPPPKTSEPSLYVDRVDERGTRPASAARAVTAGVLTSAGVVAGALAVYFGMQSNSAANDQRRLQGSSETQQCYGSPSTPACIQLKDDVNAAHTDHLASEGLWIGGAVLAAGALGTLLFWPSAAPRASSTADSNMLLFAPEASPDGLRVWARGRFW